jgi:hypothetical protein
MHSQHLMKNLPLKEGVPWARGAEPPQGIDEADPCQGHALALRCFQHHDAHQVIDQGKDGEFLHDASKALTMEHIEPHRLFEVAQIGLDLPAPMVPFGQGVGWRQVDLEEGGDHCPRRRPKARLGHAGAHCAYAAHRRERGQQRGGQPGRRVHGRAHGFDPLDELVRDAQLAEPAGAGQPLLRGLWVGRRMGTGRRDIHHLPLLDAKAGMEALLA